MTTDPQYIAIIQRLDNIEKILSDKVDEVRNALFVSNGHTAIVEQLKQIWRWIKKHDLHEERSAARMESWFTWSVRQLVKQALFPGGSVLLALYLAHQAGWI